MRVFRLINLNLIFNFNLNPKHNIVYSKYSNNQTLIYPYLRHIVSDKLSGLVPD